MPWFSRFEPRARRGSAALSVVGGLLGGIAILGAGGCSQNTDDLFHSTQGAGGAGSAGGSTSKTTTTTTTGKTSSTSTATMGSSVNSGSTGSSSVTSTASGPMCGDGMIEGNEQCDGANLGGHTCADQGYVSPTGLKCTSSCTLDFSGCKAMCGNGVVEPGEQCDDGNLNSYDGCSNECKRQGDCMRPIKIPVQVGAIVFSASTEGTSQLTSTICQDATGPELVYELTPQHAGFLTAWTDPQLTNYDAMLYANTACGGGSEIQCGDNTPHEPDLVSFPVQAGVPVFLTVDGYQGAQGKFAVHVSLSLGTCGDPVPILVGDSQGVAEHVLGDTANQGDDSFGTCGGHGPDVTYAITRMAQGKVDVATTAMGALQSVTYARSTCGDTTTEIACNAGNPSSAIAIPNASSTPTYLWVDSKGGTQGPYDVSLTP